MPRTSFGDRETARGGENVQGRDTVDHPLLLRQLISHPVYISRAWAQTAQVESLKLCPKMEEPENQRDRLQSPGPLLFLCSSSQTTTSLFMCFEHPLETRHLVKLKKKKDSIYPGDIGLRVPGVYRLLSASLTEHTPSTGRWKKPGSSSFLPWSTSSSCIYN